jgi:integrase
VRAVSVHRRNGKYQVKWRDGDGQHSRTFRLKRDADAFDREVNRAKQLGPKLLRELTAPSSITLRQFVNAGWRAHAVNLDPKTREKYRWALRYHLRELLDVPLADIDVPRIAEHQQHLLTHPRAAVEGERRPPASVRSVTTVRRAVENLSGILQIATEHGLIPGNPARSVRKVPAERKPPVRPLSSVELEATIAALSGRDRIIALLLGHCGLRPVEARLVPWRELRENTLTIRADLTKATAAYARTITVPAETLRELRRWRLESGVPGDDEPIIGPADTNTLYRFGPERLKPTVAATIGRTDGVTPYLLRHTHASLLHYCGHTVRYGRRASASMEVRARRPRRRGRDSPLGKSRPLRLVACRDRSSGRAIDAHGRSPSVARPAAALQKRRLSPSTAAGKGSGSGDPDGSGQGWVGRKDPPSRPVCDRGRP